MQHWAEMGEPKLTVLLKIIFTLGCGESVVFAQPAFAYSKLIFIVNFENISNLVLVLLLSTLSM